MVAERGRPREENQQDGKDFGTASHQPLRARGLVQVHKNGVWCLHRRVLVCGRNLWDAKSLCCMWRKRCSNHRGRHSWARTPRGLASLHFAAEHRAYCAAQGCRCFVFVSNVQPGNVQLRQLGWVSQVALGARWKVHMLGIIAEHQAHTLVHREMHKQDRLDRRTMRRLYTARGFCVDAGEAL